MNDLAVLHSSEKMDWRTPSDVLDLVRGVGIIGLDPCATLDKKHHFAAFNLTEDDDGLEHDWSTYVGEDALVFVNPPYGRALPHWVEMCATEAESCDIEIVLLVPSRTDTRWFRLASESADARCLWYGRLRFEDAPSSAPFPSACFYWGPSPYLFASIWSDAGEVSVL